MKKKLTKKQWEELLRLNKKAQPTFGKGRARTQNTLVGMNLAKMFDDGFGCMITKEGQAEVAARLKKGPPARTVFKVRFHVEATLDLSEDMLSAILTDEWRGQFYRLMNSYDVAEHVAHNFVRNRADLKIMDGFADRDKSDAILLNEDWEMEEVLRVVSPPGRN